MEVGANYIRRIRGDNYCGIRASLFQILRSGAIIPSGMTAYHKLEKEVLSGSTWLKQWTFANRLPYNSNNITEGAKDCLGTLDFMVNTLNNMTFLFTDHLH